MGEPAAAAFRVSATVDPYLALQPRRFATLAPLSPILIDSDVLVWLTRGYAAAARRLPAIDTWHISVVTYIELAQGCRDKAELARLKKGLAASNTEIVPVTPAISRHASLLIDELALSHERVWRMR